ncbi:patatin-like phospholipase family protein [Enterovirga rhinocerotis]|uniref:NTE family protein n=1 Tax=Enterovirga rhinocerotis TaxID=1339210 RepID=A0A4R7BWK6_9HYPH|nr:patatin-like phospholipase family protein [Enterovirga rhinocerotis]TDR89065.1 NTE family protein [Enterovirga rhinocerotis]
MTPSSPTFALALGGGGARGLAHIHVIETLDELGIRPVAVAGSSIGGIMGAALAAGMSGRDIHDYARSILGRPAAVAGRIWGTRPTTVADVLERGLRISQFDLERILRAFLPPQVPARFEDLTIPLSVVATDYFGHREQIIREGDLISALSASAAIPAVFRPVMREDRLLIDGGIINPVPFGLLRGTADHVIAVDVVGAPEPSPTRRLNSIDLLFGASQLMMQALIAEKLGRERPDILVRPPHSRFRALDFLKIDAVLAESVGIKEDLKRALDALLSGRAAQSPRPA